MNDYDKPKDLLIQELVSLRERVGALEGEQTLHESETGFRQIAAVAQDAIILIDNGGRITFWNMGIQLTQATTTGGVPRIPVTRRACP